MVQLRASTCLHDGACPLSKLLPVAQCALLIKASPRDEDAGSTTERRAEALQVTALSELPGNNSALNASLVMDHLRHCTSPCHLELTSCRAKYHPAQFSQPVKSWEIKKKKWLLFKVTEIWVVYYTTIANQPDGPQLEYSLFTLCRLEEIN